MRSQDATLRGRSGTVRDPQPGTRKNHSRYTESVPVHPQKSRFAWICIKWTCAAVLAAASNAWGAAPFAGAQEFLQKNCADCHSGSAPTARLDLTKLAYEPDNPDNLAMWVRVHDRVAAGEMPP